MVSDRQPSRRPTVTANRAATLAIGWTSQGISVVARGGCASFSRVSRGRDGLYLAVTMRSGGASSIRCGFPPGSSWSRVGRATSVEAGESAGSRCRRFTEQLTGGAVWQGKAARAAGSPASNTWAESRFSNARRTRQAIRSVGEQRRRARRRRARRRRRRRIRDEGQGRRG